MYRSVLRLSAYKDSKKICNKKINEQKSDNQSSFCPFAHFCAPKETYFLFFFQMFLIGIEDNGRMHVCITNYEILAIKLLNVFS